HAPGAALLGPIVVLVGATVAGGLAAGPLADALGTASEALDHDAHGHLVLCPGPKLPLALSVLIVDLGDALHPALRRPAVARPPRGPPRGPPGGGRRIVPPRRRRPPGRRPPAHVAGAGRLAAGVHRGGVRHGGRRSGCRGGDRPRRRPGRHRGRGPPAGRGGGV